MLPLVAVSLALSVAAATPGPTSEQALIEEAWRAAKDPAVLSPPPAAPIPGSFAEHAGPALERLQALWKSTFGGPEKGALQGVLDGLEPYESLPAPTRAVVEKALPDVLQVLAATHARSGKLPVGLTGFMPLQADVPGLAGELAVKLAAIEIRRELAAQQGDPIRLCADSLAVAGAYAGGNLLGRMLSIGIGRGVIPTCLAVIAQSPAPRCERLDEVLAEWPPLSRSLEQEKLFVELSGYGNTLDEQTVKALPVAARHILGQASGSRSRLERLRRWFFGSWARSDFVEAMNRAIAALDGPRDRADAAFEALAKERPRSSWLVGGDGSTDWLALVRRDRDLRTRLTALADLCRWRATRTGDDWPTPPPLGTDTRTGKPLRAEVVDDAHVRIVADADPGQEAERVRLDLTLSDRQGVPKTR